MVEFSHNKFAKSHINGIESLWFFVKRRLAQYNNFGNGLSDETFSVHLKKCEFRNKDANLSQILLKILRKCFLNSLEPNCFLWFSKNCKNRFETTETIGNQSVCICAICG